MWLIQSDKKLVIFLIKELISVALLLLLKIKMIKKLLNRNKTILIINKLINLYQNKRQIMLLKTYRDVNWVKISFMIHIM
jgi:hypothetical protein